MSNKKKTESETPAADSVLMREELLEGLLSAKPFAFDLNADALYQQYRDSYMRQGNDAARNAFGKATALTGGYANSYAQSVAQQTYNDYMLALQDKGLQLYEQAYDRYQDDFDRQVDLYKLTDADEKERYDRTQATQKQLYEQEQDELSFAYKMAQMGDFSYLKALGKDVSGLESAAEKEAAAPEKISVTIQNTASETYYTYGYKALVRYLDQQIAYGQLTEKGKTQVLVALTGRTQ